MCARHGWVLLAKLTRDAGTIMHTSHARDMHHSRSSCKHPHLSSLRSLNCRAHKRATMATSAQEEEHAVVNAKRPSAAQALKPAKARRIVGAVNLVYLSLGPVPPLAGVLSMPGRQAHRLVPLTRSRTDICKFRFWIADLSNICSRLRLVQANRRKSEIHYRMGFQRRGTLHFHYLCGGLSILPAVL